MNPQSDGNYMLVNRLTRLNRIKWYWPALFAFGLVCILVALFYQYTLDYRPCVMCIHVRLWVMAFMLVAVFAMLVRRAWLPVLISHVLNTAIMAILLERSYQLLGTERGWTFGSCGMELGLPAWLTFEEWFPSLFKVWEPCGYTPEMLFGITMAETLVAVFAALTVISVLMLVACLLDRPSRRR